jgi:sulfate/thiosulfate transport system ATP-binding protein
MLTLQNAQGKPLRAHIGAVQVAFQDYPHDEPRPAALYVRPHELDIDRQPGHEADLRVRVLHCNPAGSVTRVHLQSVDGERSITVDLTHDRHQELDLQQGETVYVSPRRVRVFVPDYAI